MFLENYVTIDSNDDCGCRLEMVLADNDICG